MSAQNFKASAALVERGLRLGFISETVDALAERRGFETTYLIAAPTRGGTYVVASHGRWNDDGKHRDLLAILPGTLMPDQGGIGPVVPLSIFVSPELLAFVADVIAEARS